MANWTKRTMRSGMTPWRFVHPAYHVVEFDALVTHGLVPFRHAGTSKLLERLHKNIAKHSANTMEDIGNLDGVIDITDQANARVADCKVILSRWGWESV